MATDTSKPPKNPPAWFIHFFWKAHRGLHKLSGGRFLWTPEGKKGWGAMRLTTTGRKSGKERTVIVGYLEEGPDLAVVAMNGWDEGDPAWWLNLQAHPDAVVQLKGQDPRPVRARKAAGEEHDRLWQRWLDIEESEQYFADQRATETPVIVFEPRDGA